MVNSNMVLISKRHIFSQGKIIFIMLTICYWLVDCHYLGAEAVKYLKTETCSFMKNYMVRRLKNTGDKNQMICWPFGKSFEVADCKHPTDTITI